jgi:hypothetical protein
VDLNYRQAGETNIDNKKLLLQIMEELEKKFLENNSQTINMETLEIFPTMKEARESYLTKEEAMKDLK